MQAELATGIMTAAEGAVSVRGQTRASAQTPPAAALPFLVHFGSL